MIEAWIYSGIIQYGDFPADVEGGVCFASPAQEINRTRRSAGNNQFSQEVTMQDRRDFLKTTAAAASLLSISALPQTAAASDTKFKNIIYTKDDPGRWEGKQGTHVPKVTVTGSKVSVVTNHPMSDEHYIVKHALVLANGTYIGSKLFTSKDKPESEYELPAGYKGKFYVTSFCNLHDFWLAEAMA
jgi:superoxide reductase